MASSTIDPSVAAKPRVARGRARWSWLARGVILSFGLSLGSGLYLYVLAPANWNAGQAVLAAHIGLGLAAIAIFSAWLWEHLRRGLKLARNPLYRNLAYALVGLYAATLLTGLANTLPLFLYLAGIVWFPSFETFDLVATLHLASALLVAVTLVLHVLLPFGRR